MSDEIVRALRTMPPNVFTQCSLGTQGKVLSIPALVRRYLLGSSVTAIWQRRDRGGRRTLAISVVLDLTPSHPIHPPFVHALFALLSALERLHVSVQVLAYTLEGVWMVHTSLHSCMPPGGAGALGGGAWDGASKARLLALLAAAMGAVMGSTSGGGDVDCDASARHDASAHHDAIAHHDASAHHDARRPETAAPPASCFVREAILLGVQLLLAAPIAPTSPRMVWLFTAGAAHTAAGAIGGACALAQAKNVEVVALSLRGASLRSLGCPRWLSAPSPSDLPALVTAIFSTDEPLSAPPDAPPPPVDVARLLAACIGVAPATAPADGAGAPATADKAFQLVTSNNNVTAVHATAGKAPAAPPPPSPPPHVYLSRALDYSTRSAEVRAPSSSPPPPAPREDEFEDEIVAFYRKVKSSSGQVRTATRFAWTRKGISEHDGFTMARIFSMEKHEPTPWNVRHLSLEGNALADRGLQALSLAWAHGALSHLSRLTLTWNSITHAGMKSFAAALRHGALPRLEWLFLNGNQIGDAGVLALATALEDAAREGVRVLAHLQQLWLHENGIGDAGVEALVRSFSGGGGGGGGGALPSLTTLSLDNNRIRLEGARRLVEGLRSGALPQCTNLLLNDNPAGRRAQDEVNEVLKRRRTS
jgi:hypothetical protein